MPARRSFLAACLALALAGPGCVSLDFPSESSAGVSVSLPAPPPPAATAPIEKDAGDVRLAWDDVRDAQHAQEMRALQGGELDGWVQATNALLALPYDVTIRHAECGEQNAYYDPQSREVVMCYELLDAIAATMAQAGASRSEAPREVGDAWLFVLFHELGHALIDAYQLPIAGREEDAADAIATLTLIHEGAPDAALDAAVFWSLISTGEHSASQYADEHSLNEQRYFAILCTVYGSDPQKYAWLLDEGYLPPQRGPRCVQEYAREDASWSTLLAPWSKPIAAA